MKLDAKSIRGKLVETIFKSTIFENMFTFTDEYKEILQNKMNSDLNFKTDIIDIKKDNDLTFIHIVLENENGEMDTVNFTIINKTLVQVLRKIIPILTLIIIGIYYNISKIFIDYDK